MRKHVSVLLSVVVAVAVLCSPVAGAGEKSKAEQVRELEAKRAERAANLDLLNANEAEVRAAIATLDAHVAAQTQRVAQAQDALAQAMVQVTKATAAEAAKRAEIAELTLLAQEFAVNAFINPTISMGGMSMLAVDADSLTDVETAKIMVDAKNEHDRDVLADLEVARKELTGLRRAAQRAERAAEVAADEAATALGELEAARAEQTELRNRILADIDSTEGEIAFLDAAEADLRAQIAADEAKVAAMIAEQKAALRAELAPSATKSVTSAGPSGPAGPSGSNLRTVAGFTVHADIADALELLVADAAADGIILKGWGWRDSQRQIDLRIANGCPDVYTAPPSSCRVPTARPGTSLHEIGLAVDFTNNGASINSRSNPAFVWLAAHAADYGFYNLPSEPWHWSVTGG